MTEISIIIPVYNVASYLGECLDSILRQPFEDYEIICVNDGSTDNSLDILKNYAQQDNRIKIIDKANEGSGIARNIAIEQAQGNYILFVDGDDMLDENALSKIYKEAAENLTDILIFGGYSCYFKNNRVKKTCGGYDYKKMPKKYYNKVFSSEDITKDIFKFPAVAWTKLYKTSFIKENNIKFQEIKVGQDQLFYFHSMISAKRMKVMRENLYCYRKDRAGSAMTVKKKKNFSPIYVFYGIENLLGEKKLTEKYQGVFINKYFNKATSWLAKFESEIKSEYYKEFLKLLEHIKTTFPDGWWKYYEPDIRDNYLKTKMKIFIAKQKYKLCK